MKEIILFEHMKFWRSKKNIAVFLIFVAALLGMILFNSAEDKAYWTRQAGKLDLEFVQVKRQINQLETEINELKGSNPVDVEEIERLELYREFLDKQRLFIMNQRVHALHNNQDRAERLVLWIDRDQHLLKGLEEGHDFLAEKPALVQQRLSANQYMLQEKIEPLNSPYEMTAETFVYHLTSYPWILFILIAIAVLNIDMFSGDMDGGAYKYLYSGPLGRSKILAGKYLVHALNSFFVTTGLVIVVFGVIAVTKGLNNPAYPTFYYTASYYSLTVPSLDTAFKTLSFLPWTTYILRTLPLYSLLCWFFISLTGTASLLLKNTANVFSNLICLLFLDFGVRTLFPVESSIRMFWPLSAAGLNNVLQGICSLTASAYLIILSVSTVLMLACSLMVLKTRDLTGGID